MRTLHPLQGLSPHSTPQKKVEFFSPQFTLQECACRRLLWHHFCTLNRFFFLMFTSSFQISPFFISTIQHHTCFWSVWTYNEEKENKSKLNWQKPFAKTTFFLNSCRIISHQDFGGTACAWLMLSFKQLRNQKLILQCKF